MMLLICWPMAHLRQSLFLQQRTKQTEYNIGSTRLSRPMQNRPPLGYSPYPTPLRHPAQPGAWSGHEMEAKRLPLFKDDTLPGQRELQQSDQSSDLESIESIIGSHPKLKVGPSYESKEIEFLKDKLIETHNKLIKELDNNNKLTERLTNEEKELRSAQRAIEQLKNQIANRESELEQTSHLIAMKDEKTEEKYRAIENRFHEEAHKNFELREEIENTRSKMMECIMQKTSLEEHISSLQSQLKDKQVGMEDLSDKIGYKTDLLFAKENQINLLNKKIAQIDGQLEGKTRHIQELQLTIDSRKEVEQQLKHLLKIEQQRNSNLSSDVAYLQSQNNNWQRKIAQLQQGSEKEKEELLEMLSSQEINNKNLSTELRKLSEELQVLTNIYNETERELTDLKKRPVYDAEKKRRRYEITKEFVQQLENEQQLYGNTLVPRHRTPASAHTNLSSPMTILRPPGVTDNRLVSPQHTHTVPQSDTPKSSGYFQNRSSPNKSYLVDERPRITGSTMEELEASLNMCNLEKKKIQGEIEKTYELKVKTRQMIVKRKRLDEELEFQDEKIKRIKEEIRKIRFP